MTHGTSIPDRTVGSTFHPSTTIYAPPILSPRAGSCQGELSCELAQQIPLSPAFSGGARRHFPLLLLLFAGSGRSALIYEIVWAQLLQLGLCARAVSLG